MLEAGNEMVSLWLTVFDTVSPDQNRRFPLDAASKIPIATTVTVPFVGDIVAVPNEMVVPFDLTPPDAAGQLVELLVTATRA